MLDRIVDFLHFQPNVIQFEHWVDAVAIGNPERHMRKSSHCGSKQQWSSHAVITLRVR